MKHVDRLESHLSLEAIASAVEQESQSRQVALRASSDSMVNSILHHAPVPIGVLDVQGRVMYANAASTAASGHSEDEIIGRTWREVYGGEFGRQLHEAVIRTMQSGEQQRVDVPSGRAQRPAGDLLVTPLTSSAGNVIGATSVMTSIPDHHPSHVEVLIELGRVVDRHGDDPDTLLEAAVELLVPRVADLALIDLV